MNFKSIINDVCCDSRIKDGVLRLDNPNHVFILREYLEKVGYDVYEITQKTSKLLESIDFPDQQAYDLHGNLITFSNKKLCEQYLKNKTHRLWRINQIDESIDEDVVEKKEKKTTTDKPKKADKPKKTDKSKLQKKLELSVDEFIGLLDQAIGKGTEGTKIVESIPLLKLIGVKDYDSFAKASMDGYDFLSDGKEWVHKMQKFLETNPDKRDDFMDWFNTYAGKDKDLNSIAPGVTDFIHASVEHYKKVIKSKTNVDNESKDNTADVILVYGGQRQSLLKSLLEIKSEQDLIVDGENGIISFKNNPSLRFAQVSLKKGSGRLGNIRTKFFQLIKNKVGEPETPQQSGETEKTIVPAEQESEPTTQVKTEELNESVSEFVTAIAGKISDSLRNLKGKFKSFYDFLSVKIKTLFEGITSLFRDIPMVDINAEDKRLEMAYTNFIISNEESINSVTTTDVPKNVEKDIDKTKDTEQDTTDVKDTDDIKDKINRDEEETIKGELKELAGNEIPITSCNWKQFNEFYNLYNVNNFEKLIGLYRNYAGSRKLEGLEIIVGTIEEGIYKNIHDTILNVYGVFKNAVSKSGIRINEINEAKSICADTKVKISRKSLEPILKLRANHVALRKIIEFLNSINKNADKINIDMNELPSIAANLSAEAMFGNNLNLPLWKFTGSSLTNLGTKQQYIKNKMEQFSVKNLKESPVCIIQIYQVHKPDAMWFITNMYVLFDIIENDDKSIEPEYAIINFTVGSGSKFAIKIEMNGTTKLSKIPRHR